MRTFHHQKRKFISFQCKLIFYFLGVFLLFGIFYRSFNQKVSPKLIRVAQIEFSKIVDKIASDYGIMKEFDIPFDDLLRITKNNKGEILTVDYKMSDIYAITHLMTTHLMEAMNSVESPYISKTIADQEKNYDKNTILLMMPMGVASDYIFLNPLGPKIPVLVRFVDSVYTNVKTRLTNYGLNNALVELYLEVSLKYELITPVVSEQQKLDYTVLLHAKVIQGTVPNWYGGEMITKSNGVNESIL